MGCGGGSIASVGRPPIGPMRHTCETTLWPPGHGVSPPRSTRRTRDCPLRALPGGRVDCDSAFFFWSSSLFARILSESSLESIAAVILERSHRLMYLYDTGEHHRHGERHVALPRARRLGGRDRRVAAAPEHLVRRRRRRRRSSARPLVRWRVAASTAGDRTSGGERRRAAGSAASAPHSAERWNHATRAAVEPNDVRRVRCSLAWVRARAPPPRYKVRVSDGRTLKLQPTALQVGQTVD